jgi:molybdenum cofactor synthesis domain-containing protein
MSTAAALIIGDEILSGEFADSNGPFLIQWLRRHGLELRRMIYLPDQVDDIARATAQLAASHDWVFTSGGVGPTHDDVTFQAIAWGLNRELERHPELVAVLHKRMPSPISPAALRMAEVPAGAALWWEGEIAYPVVVVDNVIVLPGLPALFEAKLEAISHRFAGSPPAQRRLATRWYESQFASELAGIACRFPELRIGSYPRTGQDQPWRVQLLLEGRDEATLDRCAAELVSMLGDSIVPLEDPLGQA